MRLIWISYILDGIQLSYSTYTLWQSAENELRRVRQGYEKLAARRNVQERGEYSLAHVADVRKTRLNWMISHLPTFVCAGWCKALATKSDFERAERL